jgi:hypothetical protein
MNDSEEEYHETLQDFSESNLVVENEGKNSKDQEKDINISYTPYEEEIKESPPNMQEEFSQNKEELVEENNFENKEDSHCIEEEHFQDIANETIILNVEKKENFSLLYTPYEDISNNKFENEIEEPPPNTQEDSSLVIDDETSQENLQQEELMEEMNLEKNDEQDHPYKKEESFQEIF